jgi:uncharacterized protein (DUF2147 family)
VKETLMRLALVPIAVFWSSSALAASVEGQWLTDDRKGVVEIAPCGASVCGRIVRVLDLGSHVPATDVRNPDRPLRSRPIIGLLTLSGFVRSGAVWTGGRAYDPKSGKSYRASLQLNLDGSLRLTGCVFVICDSRRWTRVR